MSDTYTTDLDPRSLDDPADLGCCTACKGWGLGGPSSGPESSGRCWDCRGTGHLHDGPCIEDRRDWCTTCEEPADIVEESVETSGALEAERHYYVVRLACGHEIATEQRGPR